MYGIPRKVWLVQGIFTGTTYCGLGGQALGIKATFGSYKTKRYTDINPSRFFLPPCNEILKADEIHRNAYIYRRWPVFGRLLEHYFLTTYCGF